MEHLLIFAQIRPHGKEKSRPAPTAARRAFYFVKWHAPHGIMEQRAKRPFSGSLATAMDFFG